MTQSLWELLPQPFFNSSSNNLDSTCEICSCLADSETLSQTNLPSACECCSFACGVLIVQTDI